MTPKTSMPFAAARSSKDHGLTAFACAVLVLFALSAGAFLPRLDAPAGHARPASAIAASAAAAPAPATRG